MVPVGGPTTVEFTSRLSLGKFLLLWVLLRGHYGFMFYLGSTAISLPKIMIIIVATILNIVAPIILIVLAPITSNFMNNERVLFSG